MGHPNRRQRLSLRKIPIDVLAVQAPNERNDIAIHGHTYAIVTYLDPVVTLPTFHLSNAGYLIKPTRLLDGLNYVLHAQEQGLVFLILRTSLAKLLLDCVSIKQPQAP
jgi:hypothetical protein